VFAAAPAVDDGDPDALGHDELRLVDVYSDFVDRLISCCMAATGLVPP
jgi:hypothetical protein